MLQNLHGYLLKIGAWRNWLARLSDTEKVEGSRPSAPTRCFEKQIFTYNFVITPTIYRKKQKEKV